MIVVAPIKFFNQAESLYEDLVILFYFCYVIVWKGLFGACCYNDKLFKMMHLNNQQG